MIMFTRQQLIEMNADELIAQAVLHGCDIVQDNSGETPWWRAIHADDNHPPSGWYTPLDAALCWLLHHYKYKWLTIPNDPDSNARKEWNKFHGKLSQQERERRAQEKAERITAGVN